jgi:hypothetical protein
VSNGAGFSLNEQWQSGLRSAVKSGKTTLVIGVCWPIPTLASNDLHKFLRFGREMKTDSRPSCAINNGLAQFRLPLGQAVGASLFFYPMPCRYLRGGLVFGANRATLEPLLL